MAADGRLAVVRANEYRVDWYQPNGGPATRGPVVEYDPIRIDDAEKNAWADRQANRQMTMRMIGGSGGGGSRQMQAPHLDACNSLNVARQAGPPCPAATPGGPPLYPTPPSGRGGRSVRLVRLFRPYVLPSARLSVQWLERYRQ